MIDDADADPRRTRRSPIPRETFDDDDAAGACEALVLHLLTTPAMPAPLVVFDTILRARRLLQEAAAASRR